MGGSNGGLLMGNMLTQYPELFGAVVVQVPLLDMKRYSHLLAGASWMAEYGDPDTADWDYIRPSRRTSCSIRRRPIRRCCSRTVDEGRSRAPRACPQDDGEDAAANKDVRTTKTSRAATAARRTTRQSAHMNAPRLHLPVERTVEVTRR
jgi:prolyl oligopeptidase